jgi:CHAT domain-containing protein
VPPELGDGALLVGAPRLAGSEFPRLSRLSGASDEISALQQLYPRAKNLAGGEATAPALLAALPRAALLHLAGHAVAHPGDPARSFLPLAPDPRWPGASMLTAHDIAGLDLRQLRLAVLSACDTFEPLARRTEGISGVARALMDAGARAVVGTLWSVEDRPTSELLVEFHRQLQETGDAAAALRAAQLHQLHHPDAATRDTSNWSSFELVYSSGS